MTISIGLDLDGTTGNYSATLLRFMAQAEGRTTEAAVAEYLLAKGEPADYAMSNWFANREEFMAAHLAAVDAGLYRAIPVFENASDRLWALSDEGHSIHIVTSRYVGHHRNARVTRDTADWLDDNAIPFRSLHMSTHDKTQIKCDVWVEDSPSNIENLRATGTEVIVYDAPYNRHLGGRRAHNWDEVYAHLQEIAAIRSYL